MAARKRLGGTLDEAQTALAQVERSITTVMQGGTGNVSFEDLYKQIYNLVLWNCGDQVRDMLLRVFTSTVGALAPADRSAVAAHVARWKDWVSRAGFVSDSCTYFERRRTKASPLDTHMVARIAAAVWGAQFAVDFPVLLENAERCAPEERAALVDIVVRCTPPLLYCDVKMKDFVEQGLPPSAPPADETTVRAAWSEWRPSASSAQRYIPPAFRAAVRAVLGLCSGDHEAAATTWGTLPIEVQMLVFVELWTRWREIVLADAARALGMP